MMAWAQTDSLERFSRNLGLPSEAWAVTLVMVGVLIVLAAILHLLFSTKERGGRRARRLFRRFAQASGLTTAESGLLMSTARAVRLEDPSSIFFRRSAFEEGARRTGISLDQLETLRSKVYGP